ncbi:MAG: ADP-ribosylglycohydrolase family protein [Oscillospiraceae bacterium]|jgi:ADP-ribosylglycohydrolase|nr:ADP-ribosylglycohydrolase family protein [Oscillospiraceae bacterium]
MLGAIVGDIAGSRVEYNNNRSKDFDLFGDGCVATVNSIMSLAVAKAVMACNRDWSALPANAAKYIREVGRKYPDCGFGEMFCRWIFSDNPEPSDSFDNGAATRVSPCGFIAKSEWEAAELSEMVTAVAHENERALNDAEATAVAISMAWRGYTKSEILASIERKYSSLDNDNINGTFRFNETCKETVLQAIKCFLASSSFEDAIRSAISIGGDSGAIGAIAGAIAEAYYGVPDEIKEKALHFLDEELRAIYDEWERFCPPRNERYWLITKYIGKLTDSHTVCGEVISWEETFPFDEFEIDWLLLNLPHCNYGDILKQMGVSLDFAELTSKEVSSLGAEQVLALIASAFRDEHFGNGILVEYFRTGAMLKWLKRLKDIDWGTPPKKIIAATLKRCNNFRQIVYTITYHSSAETWSMNITTYGDEPIDEPLYADGEVLQDNLAAIHFEYWKPSYPQEGAFSICDGQQWSAEVFYEDGRTLHFDGDNTYPPNWNDLLAVFGILDEDYAKTKPEPGEIIYLSVSFDSRKTYYYITVDDTIEVCDEVIVPVGANNNELIGKVEDVEYFLPENVPFPLDKTKAIIRKANAPETNGD